MNRLRAGGSVVSAAQQFSGASLYMDFTTGTYFGASATDLTVVRASSAYAETNAATLTSFGNNVARITDRGMLVEEARTNLVLQSQTFDNASWTKTQGSATADQTAAPDGTTTADIFVPNTSAAAHLMSQAVTVTAATTIVSCYVKAAGYSRCGFKESAVTNAYATFNLSTGALIENGSGGTGSIQALANGWYRIIMSYTGTAAAHTFQFYVMDDGYTSGTPSAYTVAGNGTSGVYWWGAQIETGAFVTSYIPTTVATATRAVDAISLGGTLFSGVWNNATGTAFVEARPNISNSGGALVRRWIEPNQTASPSANRHIIGQSTTDTGQYTATSTSVSQASITAGSVTAGNISKIAAAWNTNDFQVCVNATLGTQDTSGTVPASVDELTFGNDNTGTATQVINGYIRRVALYKSRLVDATLQSLTT